MRRSSAGDWGGAIALSLGLHLALVLIVLLGYFLARFMPPSSPPGAAISAELVDGDDLSSAMRKTLRNRPEPVTEPEPLPQPEPEPVPEPEPLPEPVQEQPKPQDFIPVPDEVDQAEVTDQPTPLAAKEDKVQEAKQRQAQVDLTEQQRQQEAQRQQRLTEMERQRLKQLEDIRRRRAAAAQEASLAEERLKQLADARSRNASEAAAQADAAASRAGAGGNDEGLQARYIAAIQAAVLSKWSRPESVALGSRCKVIIRQIKGGSVTGATVTSPCELDEAGRRSVEAAVLKAQPLPYAGFEPVFQRELTLNFRAEDR